METPSDQRVRRARARTYASCVQVRTVPRTSRTPPYGACAVRVRTPTMRKTTPQTPRASSQQKPAKRARSRLVEGHHLRSVGRALDPCVQIDARSASARRFHASAALPAGLYGVPGPPDLAHPEPVARVHGVSTASRRGADLHRCPARQVDSLACPATERTPW